MSKFVLNRIRYQYVFINSIAIVNKIALGFCIYYSRLHWKPVKEQYVPHASPR